MMMHWYWVQIAIFLGGAVIGGLVKWGYLHIKGIRVRVPYVDRSDASVGVAIIVITVLSLVTIIQTQANTERADECNRQFREALRYNNSINNEQRELNDRARDISVARRGIQDHMLIDVTKAIGDPARIHEILTTYNAQALEYVKQYDRVTADAKRLDTDRKAYPDPECGR